MNTMRKLQAIAACAGAFGAFATTSAATFCVSNPGQFAAALSAAQTDNDNDIVYVVAGTYNLSAGLEFDSTQAYALTLVGGVDATCSTLTGTLSILNGQNLYRALSVSNSNGAVAISRMGFENGSVNDLNGGAGLYAYSSNGNILIGLSRFANNAGSLGGGLSVGTEHGQISFANNLVVGNTAFDFGAGTLYQGAGEAYVIGNTVADNGNQAGQNTGGLAISGNAHFTLANNILWGNTNDGGYDLYAGAAHSRLNNDLGIVGGTMTIPDAASGNVSVDPRFVDCGVGCGNYELDSTSLLIDAGNDAPGYGVGTLDLAFRPRIVGAHIDIGAFENADLIFRDGFGP
ncbi:MAG: hypothetical protein WBV39_14010 [Rudaea sp.]